MRSSSIRFVAAVSVLACVSASFAKPGGYDAAAEFSSSNNPNSVWSYGYETTLGTGFTLETMSGTLNGLDYWLMGPDLPGAYHNPTGSLITSTTVEVDPGMLILHPGPAGEFSLARFTAPSAGWYQFSASFIGQDFAYPTSTDVHLLVNGAPVFGGLVNTFHGVTSSGAFTVLLGSGDTIDAAVGWGVNGNYYGDSTGLRFVVDAVPAPGVAALLGLGGLASLRRRRV